VKASNSSDVGGAVQLPELLERLAAAVTHPSVSQTKLLERLAGLRQRLLTERFQLAVLGQFKRGKSTLLNALLQVDVVPTGVIPVTAIPTFFVAGPAPRLNVSYVDGRCEERAVPDLTALRTQISGLVTEQHNPDNVLGINRVEVALTSSVLSHGVVLIDTPGVGSTFEHNTAAAHAALTECDAAIFVVSPDPPITDVEVQFLARIRPAVERLIVVLNKFDLVEVPDRPTVVGYLKRVLAAKAGLGSEVPVFCLSARRALSAIANNDASTRLESGFDDLEKHLTRFLTDEKQSALRAAVTAKAAALVAELSLEVQLQLSAARLPLEDLTRRVAAFDEATKAFEAERRRAHDLVEGDRRRAFTTLDAEAVRLFDQAKATLLTVLDGALARGADMEDAWLALAEPIRDFFATAFEQARREEAGRLTVSLGVH
jgi:GTPase Era involved in 16S rRNA processing